MHYNSIVFKAACDNCKNLRRSTLEVVLTDTPLVKPTRHVLVKMCDNFKDLQCELCGKRGQSWTLFKIELQGQERITRQAIVQLRVLGTKISVWLEDENDNDAWTQAEVDRVLSEIFDKIDSSRESGNTYLVTEPEQESTALIIVDFIDEYPYTEVSLFKLGNITLDNLEETLDWVKENLWQSKSC